MEVQDIFNYLDEQVFSQTGQHLDSLQMAILKGVLNGQKYAEIAKNYHCSSGHAKDEAYELWQILSEVLGEDINKSNFYAKIERLGIANNNSKLFNPIQVGNINLCPNPSSINEPTQTDSNSEPVDPKTTDITIIQRIAKLDTVPKLAKLGLTSEQIAQALDLSVDEIKQAMN